MQCVTFSGGLTGQDCFRMKKILPKGIPEVLSGFLSFSAGLYTLGFVLSLFFSSISLAFNASASSSGDLSWPQISELFKIKSKYQDNGHRMKSKMWGLKSLV